MRDLVKIVPIIPKEALRKNLLGFAALYLILVAIVTWPAVLNPACLTFPHEGDRGANVWNLWWVAHCVTHLQDPRWTPLLFHPDGCSLLHHSLSPSNGVLLAPVTLLFGPEAAYGTAFFLWSVLTGLGGMIWSRRWLDRPAEQWLAGFFMVCCAYRFAHLDHLNLFSTAGIPLSFWAFDRLKEKPNLGMALLCDAIWILTTFFCWYYGVVVGVYGLARLLGVLYERRTARDLGMALIPFALILMVVAGYLGVPLPGPSATPDDIPLGIKVFWSLPVDSLVRPAWLSPLWMLPEFRVHPGITFLILAAIEIVRRIRKHEEQPLLVWVALVYAVLALGPVAKAGMKVLPVPLPASVCLFIPGLSQMKVYARFLYPAVICLAPLAVLGVRWVVGRLREEHPHVPPPVLQAAVFLLMGSAFWFEQALPPFASATVYSGQTEVADDATLRAIRETKGAVLELPFGTSSVVGSHLARQTRHGLPLVIGEISRMQNYRKAFLDRFPSLLLLDRMVTEEGAWSEASIRETAQTFARDNETLGIGAIVVTESLCTLEGMERIAEFQNHLRNDVRLIIAHD
ncbi:MAG TPA: hypothetical protein PK395_18475 [bacterium]|nr:hypothetical protein [bacterium]